ncbi:MAG: hypothetical protein WCX73_01205 [Candidatus Pacearchaeota archaeon]|jgi:hypothetical protein
MINKKAIEIGFNVIFAIFAGVVILLLAIYGATKIVTTGEKASYTETSAKIISLLDPLETGLASGKSSEIKFKKETKIFMECSSMENSPFGKQTISFSEQTFGENFGEKGGAVPFYNKYVFSQEVSQGKLFNIFSKEFLMPFKVADLIIINTNDYCFVGAPNQIEKDITKNLGVENIKFADSLQNCTGITVCFGAQSSECDIKVFGSCQDGGSNLCDTPYDYGRVSKGINDLYYVDSLLYAAIFSSPDIYDCNLKRLMNKFNELSLIYIDKIKIIERKGCGSDIEPSLRILMNSAQNLSSSKEIIGLANYAKNINTINKATASACRLY